jgi:predicted amidohydrolase YtcJ
MTDFQLLSVKAVRLPSGIAGNAMLIRDGNVVALGDAAELRARVPDGATATDLEYPQAYAVPGLRDSHMHPVAYTALLTGASLHKADSIGAVQEMLQTAATARPGLVTGWNLNEATLAERRVPDAADLDAALSDRPVMVHRYDGHMAIVNGVVLRAAGISAATPDPEGGVIDRDAAGEPTGVLRETAIDLAVMAPDMQSPVDPVDVAAKMRGLAARGITSVGAMIRSGEGAWAHLGDEAVIVAAAAPDIPIRINAFVIADTPATLHRAAALLDDAGELVRWAGVKRFGDGSFGSHTAAMLEPFSDSPGNRGTLRLNAADEEMARISVAAGRRVAIHAIGDAAAARVLDLYEKLVDQGVAGDRLRIEHASVLAADDIARMGRLGLVASVQPAFLGSEVDWIEDRVGPDRLLRTYAFASLLAAGALVVGGSDSPVESPDPWEAMALCRDRAGIVPEEAISPEQALAVYTTSAARALGEPEPLAIGSPADFVVVDRDPISATPDELRETVVIDTYVAGRRVDSGGTGRWWID